ncbi:hypothetical protein [Desulfofundulus thermocisternus]|uniref:hypothetical protein n=1 Tax=Desulfofundulus thermocisternus TaxID=42471 RepID=UPI00068D6025|nr:hypothetical protein [Desulfofundulus thermocisternus]
MSEEKRCSFCNMEILDGDLIQLDNGQFWHRECIEEQGVKQDTVIATKQYPANISVPTIANLPINLKFLSFLSYGLAALFIITGFVVMYHYSEDSFGAGHIVGGDAYNLIIIALRGLGYIITGLAFTVVGSILLIYDLLHKKFSKQLG